MADGWSYNQLSGILIYDISTIKNSFEHIIRTITDRQEEEKKQLLKLIEQISGSNSGPLIPKTAKVIRKRTTQQIETIAEDEVVDFEHPKCSTILLKEDEIKKEEVGSETSSTSTGRLRRTASTKAAEIIKKQQSQTLNSKMRRTDGNEIDVNSRSSAAIRDSRSKRSRAPLSISEEESEKIPSKQSEVEMRTDSKRTSRKRASKTTVLNSENDAETGNDDPEQNVPVQESPKQYTSATKRKYQETKTPSPHNSNRRSTFRIQEPAAKKSNVIDKSHNRSALLDDSSESIYEDAINKPPLMNSTVNYINTTVNAGREINNATVILDKNVNSSTFIDDTIPLTNKNVINSTVVLKACMNETVTLFNNLTSRPNSKDSELILSSSDCSPRSPQNALQDRMKTLTERMANEEFDALITEDETAPENAKPVRKLTKGRTKPTGKQRIIRESSSSEENDDNKETYVSKAKKAVRNGMFEKIENPKELRNVNKPNTLFSPFAKDSVRKRVEAFEKAGLDSSDKVDADVPPRLTRTKTRAMTAAETSVNQALQAQTIAQKLARKSLAKAKRISLAKELKKIEESKENLAATGSSVKDSRPMPRNDKLLQKQQQRLTPVGQSRLPQPMSVNRIQNTPKVPLVTKNVMPKSATRSNVVTNVESFITQQKTVQRDCSADRAEERRRRMEEYARKKREEALKLKAEETRRKREEKELKNKLAREAKEKSDMQKRLKATEEKNRILLLTNEKKRLAQLQRAQEKEEKRKQEERQLAEQKRKEQEEAERLQHRKAAEALKKQQAAQTEALRIKAQYHAAQAKLKQYNSTAKPQAAYNYVIDSEPDDNSDKETNPKYIIPSWADPGIRLISLSVQEFIPMSIVYKLFGSRQSTPDLTQLFPRIDRSRLKRTSSAIWKPAPRYSMMPTED